MMGNGTWRKLGVVGALCLVAALGEARVPGSEAAASTARGVPAARFDVDPNRTDGTELAALGGDDDGPSHPAGTEVDVVRLVPAIFAWDPDVRFVYFRNMSKWM